MARIFQMVEQDIEQNEMLDNGKIAQDIITDKEERIETQVALITKREGIYNDLIGAYKKHYEEKSKHNRGLKIAFFCIVMLLIAVIIVGMTALCIIVALKWSDYAQAIPVIVSSVVTLLSTIIALPTIICNYLFHKKEDKDLLDFIVDLNKKNNQ